VSTAGGRPGRAEAGARASPATSRPPPPRRFSSSEPFSRPRSASATAAFIAEEAVARWVRPAAPLRRRIRQDPWPRSWRMPSRGGSISHTAHPSLGRAPRRCRGSPVRAQCLASRGCLRRGGGGRMRRSSQQGEPFGRDGAISALTDVPLSARRAVPPSRVARGWRSERAADRWAAPALPRAEQAVRERPWQLRVHRPHRRPTPSVAVNHEHAGPRLLGGRRKGNVVGASLPSSDVSLDGDISASRAARGSSGVAPAV
jgi:hypothetical protein